MSQRQIRNIRLKGHIEKGFSLRMSGRNLRWSNNEMNYQQQSGGRIKVGFRQGVNMVLPYAKMRMLEQVRAVALIMTYLLFFQTAVLGIPIADGAVIAVGLALVIGGLAFFMEGLMLGLMPLGEVIGVKLPQKSKLPVILVFAFLLGVGATFAEPAISVLKTAGSSVRPWEAPLLFLMLNKYSGYLVMSVGVGVGVAVVFGMIRFMYDISLKPFIYVLVSLLIALTSWSFFDENMKNITGLAWDCGAVTTGPVTVPLVLALGIGICRVVGSAGSGSSGFGVVTLASIFPIISVLLLGIFFLGKVSQPMSETEFFSVQNRDKAQMLFSSPEEMTGYAFLNSDRQSQLALFDGSKEEMSAYLKLLKSDADLRGKVFGRQENALENWAAVRGTPEQREIIFSDSDSTGLAAENYSQSHQVIIQPADLILRNLKAAVQAIVPLSIFFLLVLTIILRERLPRSDEVFLGLVFAVLGMMIFSIGIEIGLSKLGSQVGSKLPSAFESVQLPEQKTTITGFELDIVRTAITPDGQKESFFYFTEKGKYSQIPYNSEQYNQESGHYNYIPARGPLFGSEGGLSGILVVLVFAFILGYGATLAEPALNALGKSVEELTVGAFKKSLLIQTVALGVGVGIALGVAKIIWQIPLLWLLGPPYLMLMFITKISSEEFVNIGWDSAGVTTGPITVPLVLAMGLGIGGQVGVIEGFGILSMASVSPIISVLIVGVMVNRKRKVAQREPESSGQKGVVA